MLYQIFTENQYAEKKSAMHPKGTWPQKHLEPISKMRLSAHGGVANRFKMLTYLRVCSAFESVCALP
jgi:hypothetical protein